MEDIEQFKKILSEEIFTVEINADKDDAVRKSLLRLELDEYIKGHYWQCYEVLIPIKLNLTNQGVTREFVLKKGDAIRMGFYRNSFKIYESIIKALHDNKFTGFEE